MTVLTVFVLAVLLGGTIEALTVSDGVTGIEPRAWAYVCMVACGDLDPLLLLSKFILLDTTGEHDLPSLEPERALAVLSATYRWAISIIS